MEDVLKIAICEDQEAEQKNLLSIIRQSSLSTQCTVFSSGEALLEVYRPQQFDLLLMDIYMGGMNGVEVVTAIREQDDEIPVAFITTSTEHTLESYRLSALKYIEKPFQKKDIEEILELARMKRDSAPMLTIQRNGKYERVRFSRIAYLEQQTHQVNLCLQDGTIIQIYDKLSMLLPQLEGQPFFQPHKSYAVNLSYVRSVDRALRCFVMQDGSNIPIRRETMGQARQALKDFLFQRARGGA